MIFHEISEDHICNRNFDELDADEKKIVACDWNYDVKMFHALLQNVNLCVWFQFQHQKIGQLTMVIAFTNILTIGRN